MFRCFLNKKRRSERYAVRIKLLVVLFSMIPPSQRIVSRTCETFAAAVSGAFNLGTPIGSLRMEHISHCSSKLESFVNQYSRSWGSPIETSIMLQ